MVSIESEEENLYVFDNYLGGDNFISGDLWLGGIRNGAWTWSDGTPFDDYTNWNNGEPNNGVNVHILFSQYLLYCVVI